MQIIHPIEPLYNCHTKRLILGSFPSVKSREQSFFYGHPQNRFWRIISHLFNEELPLSIEDKKELILNNNLGLWDVIGSCEITGSSDSSIKNVKANDLGIIFEKCNIETVFVNGKTAEKYYVKYIEPKIKIKAVCLPSTSPANAAWSFERLFKAWSVVKGE
ncbi:MAG: DNA-deoxyinosine glycosylase [Ruminococcaceae bacterium]|nr:DNA-deoxyinosine glycosylase [Oscillospiraceae bacterium]